MKRPKWQMCLLKRIDKTVISINGWLRGASKDDMALSMTLLKMRFYNDTYSRDDFTDIEIKTVQKYFEDPDKSLNDLFNQYWKIK